MRIGWAFRIAAAVALFGAMGCDFWSNLFEEQTLTRGDLEIDVVDAWTGEALGDAHCKDSLGLLRIKNDGNGAYRQKDAPTGSYVISCGHTWYHDEAAEISITGAGARTVVKLARRVGKGNWYNDNLRKVAINSPGGVIRFPKDLDWEATPKDDSGRFLYVWSFAENEKLNSAPWPPLSQPPKEAYSPHFRTMISKENGIKAGPDRVTLKVYSLLKDPNTPELVDSPSLAIEWVENKNPTVRFSTTVFNSDSSGLHPQWSVACEGLKYKHNALFEAFDPDGKCKAIRIWSYDAPSLPGFDTILACDRQLVNLPLVDPKFLPGEPPHRSGLTANGAEMYDNTLIAEIVDDNGESGRDTVHFITFRNIVPNVSMTVFGGNKDFYRVGDSVEVEVVAHDTDGWLKSIYIPWSSDSSWDQGAKNMERTIPFHTVKDSLRAFVHFSTTGFTRIWGEANDNCDEPSNADRFKYEVRPALSP